LPDDGGGTEIQGAATAVLGPELQTSPLAGLQLESFAEWCRSIGRHNLESDPRQLLRSCGAGEEDEDNAQQAGKPERGADGHRIAPGVTGETILLHTREGAVKLTVKALGRTG
jgi:hypothetical protein